MNRREYDRVMDALAAWSYRAAGAMSVWKDKFPLSEVHQEAMVQLSEEHDRLAAARRAALDAPESPS